MNRSERRKATVISQRSSSMTMDEFSQLEICCGWRKCNHSYVGDLPPVWQRLIAHHSPQLQSDLSRIKPQYWDHDKNLCPKHAKELNDLLFNHRPEIVTMTAQGRA